MITFNLRYLLLFAIIFALEVCIALFFKDTVIRPFIGDVLVVILIYCFFRIFLNISYWKLGLAVFLFACLIEILQFFDYVSLLHLENNRIISTILGRTFEWTDFLAYFTGFLVILAVEKILHNRKIQQNL